MLPVNCKESDLSASTKTPGCGPGFVYHMMDTCMVIICIKTAIHRAALCIKVDVARGHCDVVGISYHKQWQYWLL